MSIKRYDFHQGTEAPWFGGDMPEDGELVRASDYDAIKALCDSLKEIVRARNAQFDLFEQQIERRIS